MGKHNRTSEVAWYLTDRGSRVWTVPWQMVQVVRARRRMVPAPATYLCALLVGVGVGAVADLVLGWPWWLITAACVVAVGVFFLSTAFWPAGRHQVPLAIELLRLVKPDQAGKLDYRNMVGRFKAAAFPLYGLPSSWAGPRFLAAWGESAGAGGPTASVVLGLAHGDPVARDAPLLRVEVESNPAPATVRRRILAEELHLDARPAGLGHTAWSDPRPPLDERPEPEWLTMTIRVDGRAVTFETLAEGTQWVAHTTLEAHALVLRGSHMPASSIELVQITDLQPYFDGERRRLERLGGGQHRRVMAQYESPFMDMDT